MIDLDPVVERIKAITVPAGQKRFLRVEDALGYAAATKPGAALGDGPNAYVLPLADQAKTVPDQSLPQMIHSEFQVQIFLRLFSNPTGHGINKTLIDMEMRLQGALLGWSPGDGMGGVVFVRGGLSDFRNSEMWWGMTFRTNYGQAPSHFDRRCM